MTDGILPEAQAEALELVTAPDLQPQGRARLDSLLEDYPELRWCDERLYDYAKARKDRSWSL